MKLENSKVYNFQNAFSGMRYPLKSNKKSDSIFGYCSIYEINDLIHAFVSEHYTDDKLEKMFDYYLNNCIINQNSTFCEYALIGPEDLDLATRLIKGGSVHRKFLRQILASVDITAPIYLWSEIDTYKVATVANSESTMHTLHKENINWDRFEMDDAIDDEYTAEPLINFLNWLEDLRKDYEKTKDKKIWKMLKRWLPASWLQKRAYTCNYETLTNWYYWRKGHKLSEWKTVLDWIESLPYANILILGETINDI